MRIPAATDFIKKPRSRSIADTIHEHSAGASVVFLGMQIPKPGGEDDYARRLEALADSLCTTVFVHNAGEFAGKLL